MIAHSSSVAVGVSVLSKEVVTVKIGDRFFTVLGLRKKGDAAFQTTTDLNLIDRTNCATTYLIDNKNNTTTYWKNDAMECYHTQKDLIDKKNCATSYLIDNNLMQRGN